MLKTIHTLLLLCCIQATNAQSQPLFRIVQNGKTGYINKDGKVVISPVYWSGYDFSEGLAAVREHGLYGFIDETGKYVITPQYDFATDFVKGHALVYKGETSYYINSKGNVVLPVVYKAFTFGSL